jgi:hypothetical protein
MVRAEDVQVPAPELHFCWTNCFTLVFDQDHGLYRRQDGTNETWTVERFTSASVVLHRHDDPVAWNGYKTDVTYQGQVQDDRLINVTVNGNPVPEVNLAWGWALDSLPGSNAERERRRVAQISAQPVSPPPSDYIEAVSDQEVSTAEAPPPLLNYDQPPVPEDGDLWTPGYWSWGAQGYYWVPGAWVQPPRFGVLWTPGYWAFAGALYVFHPGYWGPHIGFYGGINYGFGYVGSGYVGGRWEGNSFIYNRTVSNVNAGVIRNTYSEAVMNNVAVSKVSFNGGPGGIAATPTAQERVAAAETHLPATPLQRQISEKSAGNPDLLAHAYSSHPVITAARAPIVNTQGAVKAHASPSPPAANPSSVVRPRPNIAPRPTVAAIQSAPNNTTHPAGEAVHPTTSKPAGATTVKPQHPRQ